MKTEICSSCRLPKAILNCEFCQALQCKSCSQQLKKDSFFFLSVIPVELSHHIYCGSCYEEKVAPALTHYTETLQRARNVNVFYKTQSEETRLMRRAEKPIKVSDCHDKDETLLRLAFLAAQGNFNSLIDVVITAEKVRMQAYQTTRWSGSAVPLNLDEKRLKSSN
jgi:hypothetical protein